VTLRKQRAEVLRENAAGQQVPNPTRRS
jgi:hypothetical protein